MGSDFLYTLIPLCNLTDERKRLLFAEIGRLELTDEDYQFFGCDLEHDTTESVRQQLHEHVAEYPWPGHRSVAELCPDSRQPRYLITGGMSAGDSPSDVFDHLGQLGHFDSIYALLLQWAKEDVGPAAPLQVVIEVLGGVADVTTCPPGVEVEIIDHD